MANSKHPVGRRRFLKGAAVSAAALVAKTAPVTAQPQESPRPATPATPTNAQLAADTEAPRRAPARIVEHPASDFMVDVIKHLGFEYVGANPGSSFEGLHESIINYGANKMPELLTCCHEESSVAMAHGYAKIEGKPMLAVVHGNIGLQHASMAIYNAYADRVPVFIIAGNWRDAGTRNNGVNSYHSAQDMGLIVRDCVKWDDDPASLPAFAESMVRAYKIAMTPPMEPVLIVLDHDMQERPLPDSAPRIPRLTMPAPPAGESGAVRDAARLLVAAENPRINAGRMARTPNGITMLVEEVRRQIGADRRHTLQDRGNKIADAHRQARLSAMEAAAYGWDSSPISLARLSAELWAQIKDDDWSLVSWQGFVSGWPGRLWNFDKHYRYIGGQGAGAMGYGAPAAVGAALANRKHGRLSVNIQTDGDLNYAPGVLWTACHHQIPLLTVMHNNRAYHQEVMFVQQMASQRNRGADRAHIGTTLREPNIDYAKMAQAYGMFGEGPIENPKDLAPAIRRAPDRVKRGEPALVDVITQPR